MTTVTLDLSISLDGYVAGPGATLARPLGEGGEQLHAWLTALASWRALHGLEGGETGPDDELQREAVAATGAIVMGRRMFSGGEGPWETDPNGAWGWFGEQPPFHKPVFVVTHHAREPLVAGDTTYTFVASVDAAVGAAKEAAGDRDVVVAGGADVARQALDLGLLDGLSLHVAPLLLGGGVRLFDGARRTDLELVRVLESPRATHLTYTTKA